MAVALGLDYGLRRIGLAVSDPTGTLATAIGCHHNRDGSVLARLRALIEDRGVTEIVVGLPLTADGREGEMAEHVRRFAGRLETEFGLPVRLVDERYSSQEADAWLAFSRSRRVKGTRDAVAAELILQQYLDTCAAGGEGGA